MLRPYRPLALCAPVNAEIRGIRLSELASNPIKSVSLPRVRHGVASLPARQPEHQDNARIDWTCLIGEVQPLSDQSARLDTWMP